MKATAIKVKPYRHSATSKFVVSWSSGSRPDKTQVAAWDLLHSSALPEDRARYIAGNWQRYRKFFATRKEADAFADAQRVKIVNEGTRGFIISDHIREMAVRCDAMLKPYGHTIEDAVKFFVAHLNESRRSVLVSELIPQYLAAKKQKGNRVRSLKDKGYRLSTFEKNFGAKVVATITSSQIDDWLGGLGLSATSQNNYRSVLSAFFSYAVRRDYARENPVAKVERVQLDDKPAAIFTPAKLEELLSVAPVDLLPILAIGAFAGLRQAELFRLNWSEVDIARGFIEVTAAKSKTATRRLVAIKNNLRAWLLPYASSRGPLWPFSENYFRKRMLPVRKAANLDTWPENGLRHSYASYFLAKWPNANALALEMGHQGTSMIFKNYRELVKPEDAELYWSIMPEARTPNLIPIEASHT